MKKTLLTVILLSFQIVAFSQTPPPDLRKIHPISNNVPVEARPLNTPFTGINENSGIDNSENSKSGFTSPSLLNTPIGGTTFDLQTNGSLGNKLYYLNDTVGGVWNMSQAITSLFPDRGTGYNLYDGTNWNTLPSTNTDSVFFSTIDIGSNNTEYVVGHNRVTSTTDDLFLLKRSPAGSGLWQKSVLPPHPQGNFCLWAKMAVGGSNGSSIHVVALTAPTGSGGTLIDGMNGAMTYSRSQDGGVTWDIVHEFLPGIDSTNYKAMMPESYAIDTKGNTIAIVQGSLVNDWVLWKSTDNGTTWNKNIAWEFPLQAYDQSTQFTDVNGDGIADTMEFVDSAIEVLIDNNGLVHSWAGRMRFIQEPLSLLGYFPETDGLYYWNENFVGMNPLILASAVDLDNDGIITIEPFIAIYERSLTSMPSAGVDAANNIYLVYSGIKENTSSGSVPSSSFRNTYCMVSPDGGNSWSLPVNIFDSDFDEVVYPSLARNVGPDLHITVQVDGTPGTSVLGGSPIGFNDILYISKDVNNLFAGLPVIPLNNRGLSGNVYYDQNQNGEKDPGDFGLSNYDIQITPPGTIISTNSQGNFLYNTIPGNYSITNNLPPAWLLTSDSAGYSVNLVNGITDSLDFGLYPVVPTYLVEPTLIGGFPRCNQQINYYINYHNSGTSVNAGTVRFIRDPQMGFLTSNPPYTSASADTFEWSYFGLMPFEQRTINITVNSNGLFPGDTVANVAEVVFNTATSPSTNFANIIQAISCAYDPNDKIVTPEGTDAPHYILKTDTLLYTIRFQNTGNDTAFVVKIRDTLSSFHDQSTFDFIGSSHPVNIVRQSNGAMLFTFNNILLPDSATNFAESNGYISYSIRALPGISSGTVVNNTAHIYFDFNPAIVTNTTFNTMVDVVGTEDHFKNEINLIAVPNPFLDEVNILFSETLFDEHTIMVSDVAGRVLLKLKKVTGKHVQLPLGNVTSGMYFCELVNKSGGVQSRLKIIKQ